MRRRSRIARKCRRLALQQQQQQQQQHLQRQQQQQQQQHISHRQPHCPATRSSRIRSREAGPSADGQTMAVQSAAQSSRRLGCARKASARQAFFWVAARAVEQQCYQSSVAAGESCQSSFSALARWSHCCSSVEKGSAARCSAVQAAQCSTVQCTLCPVLSCTILLACLSAGLPGLSVCLSV